MKTNFAHATDTDILICLFLLVQHFHKALVHFLACQTETKCSVILQTIIVFLFLAHAKTSQNKTVGSLTDKNSEDWNLNQNTPFSDQTNELY